MNFEPDPEKVPTDEVVSENLLRSAALPDEFDYISRGKVTSIKSQRSCGSCWSFVATGIYESALLIHNQGYHDLSEQRSLQCTRSSSCRGGYPKYALQNITSIGLPTESSYPYKNSDSYYNINYICPAGGVKLQNNI